MTGVKGQIGGGGSRKGAGRPRHNLHLDKESAKKLAILVRNKRWIQSEATEESVLALLIHNEYSKQSTEEDKEALENAKIFDGRL